MNIQSDRDALIVVDPQRDYLVGGRLPVVESEHFAGALNMLAARFVEVVIAHDYHPMGHISFASSFFDRAPFSRVTLEELDGGSVRLSDSAAFTPEELALYLGGLPGGEYVLQPDHCVIGSDGAAFVPRLDPSVATLIVRKGYRPAADCRSAFCESDGATTGLASLLTVRGIERIFVAGPAGEYAPAHTAFDALDAGFEVVFLEDLAPPLGSAGGGDRVTPERLADAGAMIVPAARILL
jgi:nicotinamidase/pyrazinamidase